MLNRIIPAVVIVAALTAVGVVSATTPAPVLAAATSTSTPTPTPKLRSFNGGGPAPMPLPAPSITVARVGDSISSGPEMWGTAHTMWPYYLTGGPVIRVDFSQGYAVGGKRLRDMAAAMAGHPVTTNYLIIEGGTNDGGPATMGLPCVAPCGTPRAEMASELVTIMQESGLPYNRIFVSAAAPLNSGVGNGSMAWWNSEEQLLCAQLGCHYFDLFAGVRQPNGGPYYVNYTFDGIHPTNYASQLMAANAAYVLTTAAAS